MDNLKEQDNTTSESIDNKDTEKAPEVYFEDLDLSDNVLDALYDMRFEKCTPVQAQCIPPILEHTMCLAWPKRVRARRQPTCCHCSLCLSATPTLPML